jgi:hypothetical protein
MIYGTSPCASVASLLRWICAHDSRVFDWFYCNANLSNSRAKCFGIGFDL